MKASVTPKMGSGGACSTSWKNEAAARTRELEGLTRASRDDGPELRREGTDETTPEEESAGPVIIIFAGPKGNPGGPKEADAALWDTPPPCTEAE